MKTRYLFSGTTAVFFDGAKYYHYSQYGEAMTNQKIGVYVEIQNKKENNLDIPLPKGTVRVYKNDTEGSLQFISAGGGAAMINDLKKPEQKIHHAVVVTLHDDGTLNTEVVLCGGTGEKGACPG